MATVLIRFDAGEADVVQGEVPTSPDMPIPAPQPTGFVTNRMFMLPEGVYCFGLATAVEHRPLWHVVQPIDGEMTVVSFTRVAPGGSGGGSGTGGAGT